MADITKCRNNEECKQKESCFRHIATPDCYQAYSEFAELIKDGKCPYYWACETSE